MNDQGTNDTARTIEDNTGIGAIRSLNYVIILCDDIEKMKRFYLDLFDFLIEEEAPGRMIMLRLGTLFLGLRARGRQYDGPAVAEQSASIQLSFRVPPAMLILPMRQSGRRMLKSLRGQQIRNGHIALFSSKTLKITFSKSLRTYMSEIPDQPRPACISWLSVDPPG